jgi:hypothetical protein
VFSAAIATSCTANARTAQGPWIGVEQAAPAALRPAEGPKPEVELRRRRVDANLLLPIPARLFGGMLLVRADYFQETRELAGADAPPAGSLDPSLANPATLGMGLLYLPHAKEGAPRFFVVVERYGDPGFADDVPPMTELIVGADIDDVDAPWSLKLHPTDEAESRLFVRWRQFPGFQRWLIAVGHKIEQKQGFFLDVQAPIHGLIGWSFPPGDWRVYGGVRLTSREHPVSDGAESGWYEGYATHVLLGARRRLAGPVFAALESGGVKERMSLYDESGKRLSRHETAFALFARLALEMWLKQP